MWLLYARTPQPDAPYWTGRRWLAAVDAAAWPLMWVIVRNQFPEPVGIVGPFVTAVALLFAVSRLRRALWSNHRYRFASLRWGRMVAGLLFVGVVLKLMLPA